MTVVLHRALTAELHVRDGDDGRTLEGALLPWGVEARVLDRGRLVVETFERGALADVDPARVPLTATHPRDGQTLPIGVTISLEERADAAWGAWHVSDTTIGNEVLALARDRVPLGLSVGFLELPGGSRWSPDRRRVVRTRAALDHVAVVRVARLSGRGRGGRTGRPGRSGGPSARHPRPAMALARACLGCGVLVRGRSRCPRCEGERERAKSARRPERKSAAETRRRRQAVAAHRARWGDWCVGFHERPGRPGHWCDPPGGANPLTADHLGMVGLGYNERGPLQVLCRSCNSARAAAILAREARSPQGAATGPPRPPNFATHPAPPDDPGPVAA